MSSTPNFPYAIPTSGTYLICAAGDHVRAAGTLVQFSGPASWTAALKQNVAPGVEPINLQDVGYMNRATGYAVSGGTVFGDTDSPVTVEVSPRNTDLYLVVTIYSGTGLTVNCLGASQSTQRPAGASLFDLNLDQVPLGVDDELEMLLNGVVTTPTT